MSVNILAVPPAGKPAGTDEGTPRAARGWTIHLDPAFLSADVPLSAPAKLLMLVLDGIARTSPAAWPSNATLAATLGISPRRVQELLVELEAGGWVRPVYADERKRVRLAIVLRRRVGPSTPAADTEERLAEVAAAVRSGRRAELAVAPTRDVAHAERGKVRTPEREKPRQNNHSSRQTKEPSAGGPVQRDDQRPPTIRETRIDPPDETDRLLARRTPAERERFGQLAPDVQARVKDLLGRSDRAGRESLRRLLEPAPSAKPTPSSAPPPLPFGDRVRRMAEVGDRRDVAPFASALALGLGSRLDQSLYAEFVKIGEKVVAGQLPAELVVGAAEAAFRPGIRSSGAYFWTSLRRNARQAQPPCII